MPQSAAALTPKSAIYIRVSTQYQVDKESLQVQRRELIAYSELVLNIRNHEVFEDPGYSAKNTDRPAYQSMMSRLRTGEFSHLLVWKIDRISRNLMDFTAMYTELKKLGVTFVSKNEQFDTSSAMGEAMLKIILVFAELERQMTAERVTAVMLSRASIGKWNGGRIPYGYSWDKETQTFSIDEEEKNIILLAYDLYEQKQSMLEVCRILNAKGYTTRNNNKWNPVTLHKIFTNVWYTGTYRYNVHEDGRGSSKRASDEWIDIKDHHPAIISEQRLLAIQYRLQKNRRGGHKKGDTYIRKSIHTYAGLLVCGNCGNNMTASKSRRRASGVRPSVYGCSTIRKNHVGCDNKYVFDMYLSDFIFSLIHFLLEAQENGNEYISPLAAESAFLKKMQPFEIKHISGIYEYLQARISFRAPQNYEYPTDKGPAPSDAAISTLRDRKRKSELALARLKSLYLYSDNGLPEKDYIIEREKILSELKEIERALCNVTVTESVSKQEFVSTASEFIMTDKILNYTPGSAEKVMLTVDEEVIKHFIQTVIKQIVVTSGKITKIIFQNQIAIDISY